MAKQKIDSYIFQNGIPLSGNRFPDSYHLIQQNVNFIAEEVNAWINFKITQAASYTVTDATYNSADGTVIATIGSHTFEPHDWIRFADANAITMNPPLPTGYHNNVTEITATTTTTISFKIMGGSGTYSFISGSTDGIISNWTGYINDSQEKCKRDTRYNLQGVDGNGGMLYDLRYGGNSQTRYLASKYWINSTPQIDGDRTTEIAAKNFVATMINNYILPQSAYTTKQSPVVYSQYTNQAKQYEQGTETRILESVAILTDVILNGLDNVPALDRAKISQVRIQTRVPSNDLLLITDTTNNEVLFNFSDPELGASVTFQVDDAELLTKGREDDFPAFLERTGTISTIFLNKDTDNREYSPNAVAVINANKNFISKEATAWQNSQIASAESGSTWDGYTFNTVLFESTMQNEIDGIVHDIKYGGNEKTRNNASSFWIQTMPQITGTRTPEVAVRNFVRDLINNYVLKNTTYTTEQSGVGAVAQNTILTLAEEGVSTRITDSYHILTNVITNGLGVLPVEEKTPIYSLNDDIQIFIDQGELRTRPYDFGTDAIERQRVSNSISMLDADFEYGLQPTKWQAIAMQRGYPSIYEVPGTDKEVQSVVTDASQGTGGIGQSLITVTTIGAHGIDSGTPITIKALENSIQGASRAEGSFIVSTVPTNNTFTYFAKSKVGTANGQVLSTFYTQLREAGFYTGAAIGAPTFTIASQGSAGVFYNPLTAPIGSDKITFNGTQPETGAPVITEIGQIVTINTFSAADPSRTAGTYNNVTGTSSSVAQDLIAGTYNITIDGSGAVTAHTVVTGGRRNQVGDTITVTDAQLGGGGAADLTFLVASITQITGVPSGAQVTSTQGSGGVISTLTTVGDYASGVNALTVADATGILPGQAIDRGDGTAIHVSTVVGQTINFDGNTATALTGNNTTYTNISGSNYQSSGFGATFDVSRAGGVYTVTLNTAGQDFEVGDVLTIQGDMVGGVAGVNDVRIEVTGVLSAGDISTFNSTGTAFDGNASFSNQSGTNLNGQGAGAIFDVSYNANVYSATLKPGFYANVGTGVTQGGAGSGATWDVVLSTNNYTVQQATGSASTGYVIGDVIRISGAFFGGADGTNDLDITVTGVGISGDITSFSSAGTGPDATANFADPNYSTSSIGTGAEINVQFTGSTYSVSIVDGGSGYSQNDTLTISGSDLGGTDPANNATVTIDSVDGSGVALSATISGTAVNSASYTNITSGVNVVGDAATFDVTQNFNGTYSIAVGNSPGSNYAVNNTIVIPGSDLGGVTPANDLTVTVTTVDTAGSITGATAAGTAAPVTNNYAAGDRLKILGSTLLGTDVTNDAIIEIQSVNSGEINTYAITGTGPDASETYTDVAYTYNGAGGSTAGFSVTRTGTSYSVQITAAGTGYLATESFTVAGDVLGGATPANDATITVQTIGASGEILTATIGGTAANTKTITNISQSSGQIIAMAGSLATFDITITNGTYSASINAPGQDYFANQSIKFLGTTLSGVSPTNDLTITISTVDGTGGITGITIAGTGPSGSGSYTNLAANALQNFGTSATFNILRQSGVYATPTIVVDGENYVAGNKIKVLGTDLGGTTPINDAIITITAVSTDGSITSASMSGTAVNGDVVQTFSTVTISEILTGNITTNTTLAFAALATVDVSFTSAHGLVPGDSFIITVGSDDGVNNHTLLEGPFFATQVPTSTSLRYQCRAPGAITDTNDITATIYPRPDAFFIHRPYDGGVQLGTGGPQHGAQAIRQSKKYIRYQSGKGIMYTTGALFAPSYDLLEVTADDVTTGSFINVTTDDVDHGLQVGGYIKLIGIETPGYNGEYSVASIVSERTFRVIATTGLGSTTPVLSPRAQVSLLNWHGATVRSGTFDDQNGIFQEYDGTNFNSVQRTATLQLAGTININVDSNLCSGTGTRFRDQLKAGDVVVIKGMTHVVSLVENNTTMYVTPDFRGVSNVTGCKICLVADKKTKQADFNKDTLDGFGSSGYIMDISKMQMIGIQYSWYGAGFIDWMLRGDDGNFIFYHRMRNSNVNTEAFMRTGNMPVRYEVSNYGPNDSLAADMDDSQTTVPLFDASFFPPNGGTVYVDNEMISYTGVNGDTLTGCTRSAPMSNYAAGANRTYTAGTAAAHTQRTGVILISNTISPIISHWGSAFQTDGGFDSDRGYIFSYTSTGNEISGTRNTVFMLRLAPSVSNAITGDLGERELLNRAQLLLEGIEITSDGEDNSNNTIKGGIVVEGILNPQNYPVDPGSVGWTGLTGSAQGGQPSFAQIAPGGGVTWTTGATQTVTNVTVQAALTDTAASLYNRNNTTYHYVSSSNWNALNNTVGVGTSVTGQFPSGTIITEVRDEYWYSRIRFRTNNRNNTGITAGQNYTFSIGGAVTNASVLNITKASWDASGAIAGQEVQDAKFPAGTYVGGVQLKSFGGTEYYEVSFTQSSTAQISPGDTVGLLFGQPPYAQPGETVFSFIAQPGEVSMLDLSTLKELTNTTLGGRGTFPNGPDVLAINVYKSGGVSTTANIILRWSEAQA